MGNKVQTTADYTSTEQEQKGKIIELVVVDGKICEKSQVKKEVKYNKDGSVKKTHCNKIAGQSSEVYAFRTKEEIQAMIDIFNRHMEEATNENQRQIAARNKMLFLIGINLGIRASDLHDLQWNVFYDMVDGKLKFKKFYNLQPKKQRKQHKFVRLTFNQHIKNAIEEYTEKYPIENINDYLFPSRKGNKPVESSHLWRIIKETAIEAGIEQNIGSHSLRKTFGYWTWHDAEDKNKELVRLQTIFNHSSTIVTARYIGITNDEIDEVYMNLDFGFNDM